MCIWGVSNQGAGTSQALPPPSWWGKTLVELDLRRRYNVNVVGLMEFQDEQGNPRVRLDTSSTVPLSDGDVLVVIGREEKLEALETAVRTERAANWKNAVDDALESEET